MQRFASSLVALGATLGLLAISAHAQTTVTGSVTAQYFDFVATPPGTMAPPYMNVTVHYTATNNSTTQSATLYMNNYTTRIENNYTYPYQEFYTTVAAKSSTTTKWVFQYVYATDTDYKTTSNLSVYGPGPTGSYKLSTRTDFHP